MLREAQVACAEAAVRGIPIGEVTGMRGERARRDGVNRRQWLRQAGSLAGAAVLAGWRSAKAAASQPRIVIVGGGAAGLRCAHRLWTERGIQSTIYEWDDRVGGRIGTVHDFFANGQIMEEHGEFISSEHSSMLSLANRFGLQLDQAEQAPAGTRDVYWFNGGYYTQAQLNADWQSFGYALFRNAVGEAPSVSQYTRFNAQAQAWDKLSVTDWIGQYVPGGTSSPFGSLCYQDAISEYGGAPEQQSALNLLYILGYDDSARSGYQPQSSPVLAGTDEKYHIHGGNDQIVAGMVNELPPGSIQLGYQLLALADNGDQTYTCTFQNGAATVQVVADHVVLAVPFTTLRNVDLSQANLSALKMLAIQNLQLGSSAKIGLQFTSRVWYGSGLDGTSFADNGAATTWECTNYQAGDTGIVVDLIGGAEGAGLGALYGLTSDDGPVPPAMAADLLGYLEPIYPGVTVAFNGLGYYSAALLDPHVGGSYSYYQIGQYTSFSGVEGQQEGNIHFAGEHTSTQFQGFMEGAVRTGERVAGEI